MKKKKKKKKTTFDLDAAFNEGGSSGEATENTVDKENQEPESTAVDDDETLDLESFDKKKKKKKKVFNLDELEAALPDIKKEVIKQFSLHILIFYCYFVNYQFFNMIDSTKGTGDSLNLLHFFIFVINRNL